MHSIEKIIASHKGVLPPLSLLEQQGKQRGWREQTVDSGELSKA